MRDSNHGHALDFRKMSGSDGFERTRGLTRRLGLVLRDGRRNILVLLGAPGRLRILIIGIVGHGGGGGTSERGAWIVGQVMLLKRQVCGTTQPIITITSVTTAFLCKLMTIRSTAR